jgi:hypothetical protein
MTARPREFRHKPPDRAALWARLRLTKAQLAALCGVSPRQVTYWTQRGYLPTMPGDPLRYDGRAVDLCLLIGQAVRHGVPLHRAIVLTRATLAREAAGDVAGDGAAPTLAEVRARLRQARAAVAGALRPIEPLLDPEASPTRREA